MKKHFFTENLSKNNSEDLSAFGSCNLENGFGYNEGKPCVFLKLNRIYGWKPDYYTKVAELPGNMPESLKQNIKSRIEEGRNVEVVWTSCEGNNLGAEIDYRSLSGEQGFNGKYFPYKNIKEYLHPLVAVQFQSVNRKFSSQTDI